MRLKSLLTFLLILISLSSIAQDSAMLKKARSHIKERQEVRFAFDIKNKSELQELSNMISIDRVDGNHVTAYANQAEFEKFAKLGKSIEVLPAAGKMQQVINMATSVADMAKWDKYPTYETYVAMMQKFAADHPKLCKLEKVGTSVEGRDLLAVKISDNVENEEAEPEFFYGATIHGDETVGYVLSLRYINYLLSNYEKDPKVKKLVDNIEIYIAPNMNPDGVYKGGNNTVKDATRGNQNGVNLNVNYPNPEKNPKQEKETEAMVNFHKMHSFVMAATLHSGYELINYPWDTWKSDKKKHADHDWWAKISRDYANSVHAVGPQDYFKGEDNGVTHGGDWYVVYGSKQDYANYYNYCREVTLELSNEKLLDSDKLNDHWNYNKDALSGYLEEVLYGISGTIKNESGTSVKGKITIASHDKDNSYAMSDPDHGNYHRPIQPGTYQVTYSADGYKSQTHTVEVKDYKTTVVKDVTLVKDGNTGNTVDISGMIKDNATNDMIQGATITLVGSTIQPAQSDAQGKYAIKEVEEGTYTFKITHPDYATVEVSKAVSATGTTFDFGMDKSTGTTIAAPTDLKASNASSTTIKLTWKDNSDNETGFAIERKSGNDDFTKIATVGKDETMYEDKDISANTEYSYKVKAIGGSSNKEYWKIWIDLNNDKDFDDKDELVFDAGSASSTAVQGKINIPASVTNLTTRMRISMKNESAPDPCESFDAGEVEDYTVTINRSSILNSKTIEND